MSSLADNIRKNFTGRRIVIVGDLVADQFLNGTISRVSREAPVFILRHDETETRPGGAANTAANVASLGGKPILIGVAGHDEAGRSLFDSLERSRVGIEHVITEDGRRTTTKVRVLAGQHYAQRQQVIRIDYEESSPLRGDIEQELISGLTAVNLPEAIIISDYGYGTVTENLYDAAKTIASEKNIPLLVDSRFGLTRFRGATGGTPNLDEVSQIIGGDPTETDCESLRKEIGYEALLVTCGNKGMKLFEENKAAVHIDAVGASEPVDVTGAGDTVIAAYSLGLASGLGHVEAAVIANHAGGVSVMKKGSAQVTVEEVIGSFKRYGVAGAGSSAI